MQIYTVYINVLYSFEDKNKTSKTLLGTEDDSIQYIFFPFFYDSEQ